MATTTTTLKAATTAHRQEDVPCLYESAASSIMHRLQGSPIPSPISRGRQGALSLNERLDVGTFRLYPDESMERLIDRHFDGLTVYRLVHWFKKDTR